MYVVMAYDISDNRGDKILHISRKYLNHEQKSIFEGEITEGNFKKLKSEIKRKADKEKDSVVWFVYPSKKYIQKENYGKMKSLHSFTIE